MPVDAAVSPSREIALRSLWIDRQSRHVLETLERAGVTGILLKGPSTARWLYRPGERDYVDLDVLIDKDEAAAADAVLRELGYVHARASASPRELDDHAWTYQPAKEQQSRFTTVDLHYRVSGTTAAPAIVWRELSRRTVLFPVGGGTVTALDEVGRALVLVLHAGRDTKRPGWQKSYEDLRRLVERLPEATWQQVAELARTLDAEAAMAVGLLQLDDGRERLRRLGIAEPTDRATQLLLSDVPFTAHRVEQLLQVPGVRAKIAFAAREAWPTTGWLVWWAEGQGFRTSSVAVLRVRRVAMLLRATPPALQAWLRVRRSTRSPQD